MKVGLYMTDYDAVAQKAAGLGCAVFFDAPLSEYTTFKVGGRCRLLIALNSSASAAAISVFCREKSLPFLIIGKGSNLIVDDYGFDGVVLLMGKDFSTVTATDETTLYCTAGTPLAKLCYTAYKLGLSGLEFAWGIPGTLGGAVYMNAGAYDGEMREVVTFADYIDESGKACTFTGEQLEFSYRHSVFSGKSFIITGASISLKRVDKSDIRAKMDDLMFRRITKQPIELPSAGSTFKRPEGSYASLLIEQCGLKGLTVGGAQVSEKHSGFIVNTGGATFADIMALIAEVERIVREKTGTTLECEPKIISYRGGK